MKKVLSAFLALLMLTMSFVSCSEDTTTPDDTTVNDTTATDTTAAATEETTPDVNDRKNAKDNLPENLKLNGLSVHAFSRPGGYRTNDWDGGEDTGGDMLLEAVAERSRRVSERLDVKLSITESASSNWKDFASEMKQNIMAGDNTWQVVLATGNASIQSGNDHLFMDVTHNKYLDFEQPWWWQNAMKELSLDGKAVRYMIGDIGLFGYKCASALFFNKQLLENGGFKADDLYKTVIDRKWTYDKLREMAAALYKDVNGDGAVNDGDQYGMLVINNEFIGDLSFSGGVRTYSRNSEGFVQVDYDQERAVKMIDTLNTLLWNTRGVEYRNIKMNADAYPLFMNNSTVFIVGRLTHAASFREMENDFGIIPVPMLDEAQGEYTTNIHNSANYFTIPVTCPNPDDIGAVLEAMCVESYRSVIEVYYDITLKAKYSRDAYSGQCIDIIRDTSSKNYLYEYKAQVGSGTLIWDNAKANKNTFASDYASKAEATAQKLNTLIEEYKKSEAAQK